MSKVRPSRESLEPPVERPAAASAVASSAAAPPALPIVGGASLFESVERIDGDSLSRIREDIGDCKRCKLHKGRTKIVFGVGNPKAELMFVGEGPGRDEDMQGEPFVGRAGKLLTQMIEAMGLQARRRVHRKRCEVPPARKSTTRKRRDHDMLAVPGPPDRSDQAESDLQPRQLFRANAASDHTRHLEVPRRVAGFSRHEADGHVPSGVLAPQSRREGRSVERPAENHGGTRPEAEEEVAPHFRGAERRGFVMAVFAEVFPALCGRLLRPLH